MRSIRFALSALGGAACAAALAVPAAADAPADTGAAPTPSSPTPTWTVRGFSSHRWLGATSAAVLTESRLTGGGLAVDRRLVQLGLPGPFPVLDVSADLLFDGASADGETFAGQLNNSISTWQVAGGVRARLPLRGGVSVQARVAVGGGWTHVRIEDELMSSIAIADDGPTFAATSAIGLSLLPRLTSASSARFHAGLDVELGYTAATSNELHATPADRPEPELTIPAMYASLGDLDLSGWTLRVGLTLGF